MLWVEVGKSQGAWQVKGRKEPVWCKYEPFHQHPPPSPTPPCPQARVQQEVDAGLAALAAEGKGLSEEALASRVRTHACASMLRPHANPPCNMCTVPIAHTQRPCERGTWTPSAK